MKKILPIFIILVAGFIAYLSFRTSQLKSKHRQFKSVEKVSVSPDAAIHLSQAVQIKTISCDDAAAFDSLEFYRFSEFLDNTYPLTATKLTKTSINTFGILYHWQGADPGLAPIVLAAHYDVVPADESDSAKWLAPPFSGKIHENSIWGRGTLDDKVSVIGMMEAVEMMLGEGFVPNRSVYLAFGYDEEIGGINGAKAIAAHLKSQGIKPEFVLDEGLTITQGLVPEY